MGLCFAKFFSVMNLFWMSSLTRSLNENALLKLFSKVLFTSKTHAILMQNKKPLANLII